MHNTPALGVTQTLPEIFLGIKLYFIHLQVVGLFQRSLNLRHKPHSTAQMGNKPSILVS